VGREEDYEGSLSARPSAPEHAAVWDYGIGKRACEDVFAASNFPSTRIRIPMVNGERDPYRRIESYLWRILDGGPVILPNAGGHAARHVYGGTVAELIVGILGDRSAVGKAYNLAQEESPTLAELLRVLCELLGAEPRFVSASAAFLDKQGLSSRQISPFSTYWMSCLDPELATRELGFRHPPLREYLGRIVASFLAHPPAQPPENYAARRLEVESAERLS